MRRSGRTTGIENRSHNSGNKFTPLLLSEKGDKHTNLTMQASGSTIKITTKGQYNPARLPNPLPPAIYAIYQYTIMYIYGALEASIYILPIIATLLSDSSIQDFGE